MTNALLLNLAFALIVPTPMGFLNVPTDTEAPVAMFKATRQDIELSSRSFSMESRYPVASVSEVFKDNILLNVAYLDGRVTAKNQIDWGQIDKSFHSEFTLRPNEVFAYHDTVLPQYEGKVAVTTKSRFNASDGYKSDGYLFGDGVCQLASLINWAARDANLEVFAPANHDFANIPEVPKEYGVAIYFDPNNISHSANRNLYITNNQDKPVTFSFDYDGTNLKVSVKKTA